MRALFERYGLVVDEVEGRSDYGRDLIVDITEDIAITGAVIGVQVKGDRRFVRDPNWQFPVTAKDSRYWAESTVPILGILWDSASGRLRWTNLTAYARSPFSVVGAPRAAVQLSPTQDLTEETLPGVLRHARDYVRQWGRQRYLAYSTLTTTGAASPSTTAGRWAGGERGHRTLLRRALPELSEESLRQAIVVLSHLTPHPDIAWHAGNWVPEPIKERVRPASRWSAQEVRDLVAAVEERPLGTPGWERGGLGQCLWSLLIEDPQLGDALLPAIAVALRAAQLSAALRLLILHQSLAEDPLHAVNQTVTQYPELNEHPYTAELLRQITEFGFVMVY